MLYPDYDTYSNLYAKYLRGDRTQQLIDAAGVLTGKHVLDLCGGGGRLALATLVQQPASVTLLDESALMTQDVPPPIRVVTTTVHAFLRRSGEYAPVLYDAVFCQQAINYWLDDDAVALLRNTMSEGGVFVFNTFNKKPLSFPVPKMYTLDGKRYLETSWLSHGDMVEHVQICENEAPHTTRFKWFARQTIKAMFEPHFSVVSIDNGDTSIYLMIADK